MTTMINPFAGMRVRPRVKDFTPAQSDWWDMEFALSHRFDYLCETRRLAGNPVRGLCRHACSDTWHFDPATEIATCTLCKKKLDPVAVFGDDWIRSGPYRPLASKPGWSRNEVLAKARK